jgi:hypothetical protein
MAHLTLWTVSAYLLVAHLRSEKEFAEPISHPGLWPVTRKGKHLSRR